MTKTLWNREGRVPALINLVWGRITFSRLTTAYFIFSLCHCIIQVSFQARAFTVNKEAASSLSDVVLEGNASTPSGFLVLRNDLRLCPPGIPNTISVASCQVVWEPSEQENQALVQPYSTVSTSTVAATSLTSISLSPTAAGTIVSSVITSTPISSTLPSASPTATSVSNASDDGIPEGYLNDDDGYNPEIEGDAQDGDGFRIKTRSIAGNLFLNTIDATGAQVSLNNTCLVALNYPVMVLDNTKREDVAFVLFQVWVLGMSVVALLNESVPHIVASLLTHVVATAWSGFQLYSTASFHSDYTRLITNGACHPADFLPHYWTDRGKLEILILVFNAIALLLSGFMTWKLLKAFGWQTFKRVGASRSVNRMYMVVLSLSITIQLALFFNAVTLGTWIDQLRNGDIGSLASFKTFYTAIFMVTLVSLIPWLVLGWIAVRRELKVPMLVFLVISVWFFAGWGGMFLSTSFRWTFVTWKFFGAVASAALFLTLTAFVLGLICWWNFGRGLAQHLAPKEVLPGEDFIPVNQATDIEKVAFPSYDGPIPTYSSVFIR